MIFRSRSYSYAPGEAVNILTPSQHLYFVNIALGPVSCSGMPQKQILG